MCDLEGCTKTYLPFSHIDSQMIRRSFCSRDHQIDYLNEHIQEKRNEASRLTLLRSASRVGAVR